MSRSPTQLSSRRYRIERYLTEGGMGAIYVGKKTGPVGFEKEVVLKQLLPEFTQRPEFRDLFFREAKISATLDHANIVHTFDLVESDQALFIVMEYVRGADLRTMQRRARIRRCELSPAAALHIGLEVLAGLGYAHGRKAPDGTPLDIIHRDISPSNILCSVQGEVKISDFGIAKVSTQSSVFYRVRGKVGYMSPEQATNEVIDGRSDLYSAAVCIWEALTGERLFVGDLNTPPEEIYGQPIPKVSEKRPGVPAALDAVMDKALARTADSRFQDAALLAEALRNVAHRSGMLMSAPQLAAHLVDILGPNADRWLYEDTEAPFATNTQKIPLGVEAVKLEGREIEGTGSYVLDESDLDVVKVEAPRSEPAKTETGAIMLSSADSGVEEIKSAETDPRATVPDRGTDKVDAKSIMKGHTPTDLFAIGAGAPVPKPVATFERRLQPVLRSTAERAAIRVQDDDEEPTIARSGINDPELERLLPAAPGAPTSAASALRAPGPPPGARRSSGALPAVAGGPPPGAPHAGPPPGAPKQTLFGVPPPAESAAPAWLPPPLGAPAAQPPAATTLPAALAGSPPGIAKPASFSFDNPTPTPTPTPTPAAAPPVRSFADLRGRAKRKDAARAGARPRAAAAPSPPLAAAVVVMIAAGLLGAGVARLATAHDAEPMIAETAARATAVKP